MFAVHILSYNENAEIQLYKLYKHLNGVWDTKVKKLFKIKMWQSYTQLPNIKPYGNTRSKYISDKKLVTHHYLGLKISSNRQSEWDARDTSECLFSAFPPKYISTKFISHLFLCYTSMVNISHFNGNLLIKLEFCLSLPQVFKVKLFCHSFNTTYVMHKYELRHTYLVSNNQIHCVLVTKDVFTPWND